MKPTEQMKANARRALSWYDEYPDRREFVATWMIRFAQTITTSKTWASVERVHAWFTDHDSFREAPGFFTASEPPGERIAWEMLGGDAGQMWAADALGRAAQPDPDPDGDDESFAAGDGFVVADTATGDSTVETAAVEAVEVAAEVAVGSLVASGPVWAASLIDPALVSAAEFATGPNAGQAPHWQGPITLEGVLTSDRRRITAGGLGHRDLPIPYQRQVLSGPGHDGAVIAGSIAALVRRPATGYATGESPDAQVLLAAGYFDSGPEGATARRYVEEGSQTGVSVDLTDVELDLPDDPEAMMDILLGDGVLQISSGTISAVTQVSIPAFASARIEIVGGTPTSEALVASGGALGPGRVVRVTFPVDIDEESLVASAAGSGPLTWTIPHHTFSGVDLPVDLAVMEEYLVDGYEAAATQTLVASGGPTRPPRAWFDRQEYDAATTFVVEDPAAGGVRRIHGHVGLRGSCHIGYADRCVDVPMGLDYDSFQGERVAGRVRCSNGETIPAGPVVMETDHAATRDASGRVVGAAGSVDHYAHSGCLVAQVRAYEDKWGLQVQGWILPGITDEQLARLDALDLSPDWRPRSTARNGRGVVAILAVPVSGFNMALTASAGAADDGGGPGVETVDGSDLASRAAAALSALDLEPVAALAASAGVNTAARAALAAWDSGCSCGGSCCSR